jgi:hypothetical protein
MDFLVNEDAISPESPDQPQLVAHVRDLTSEEIAALDIDTVASNNSASVEEMMKRLSHTSTPD